MRDQLGLAPHLVHTGVPGDDDVALERCVRPCQPDGIARRDEQVFQQGASNSTIEIVVTGETRRQRKEIIDRERLGVCGDAKHRRKRCDRRQEGATSNHVHECAILLYWRSPRWCFVTRKHGVLFDPMRSLGLASAVNVAPRAIVDACASAGVAEDVLRACPPQLRAALGRHGTTRLPVHVVNQLWSDASRRIPTIGLAAALRVPFGAYLMYDAALATSATVEDVLSLAARHHSVLNSAIELRLDRKRGGQLDVMFCQSGADLVAAEYLEYVLVNTIRRVRTVAGVMWSPVKVHFPRRLAPAQVYERVIGSPVAFDSHNARVTVPAWLLARKPVLASLELFAEFERRLRAGSAKIEDAQNLIARLTDHCGRCPEGETLPRMARQVARSRRTIQRRLNQYGQSYRSLRDAVRRDAALDLLVNTRQTCEAIASAVGFSEPSAFSRAFRRWTGRSPGAYRRDQ